MNLLQCVRILPGARPLRYTTNRNHRNAILAARGLVVGFDCCSVAVQWRNGEVWILGQDEVGEATLGDAFP